MYDPDDIYFSRFSQGSDFDPIFEEDYLPDYELDGELNQFLDITDLDDPDDLLWEEN